MGKWPSFRLGGYILFEGLKPPQAHARLRPWTVKASTIRNQEGCEHVKEGIAIYVQCLLVAYT